MKPIKFNRVFQIIYPILVYYIIYNFSFGILQLFFEDSFGKLFCLLVAGIITLIPELIIYNKAPHLYSLEENTFRNILIDLALILLVIAIGILLNILITNTPLLEYSGAYQNASNTLSNGTFIIKILCNVITIPILEEILYRGIVCGQICIFRNEILATVFSAFCFGFLHFNIVQFLYAFIIGLVLGYIYCKRKKLWIVIAAHALTNLVVILCS